VTGQGIEGTIDGVRYRLGRCEYVLSRVGQDERRGDTCVSGIALGDEQGLLAEITLSDGLRADVPETFARLRTMGVALCIASGDRIAAVSAIASQLGTCTVRGDMQAVAKLELVRELQRQGRRVAMVGDGVNDAPVLAGADVSLAIGSGTDLARISADLVLLGDGLKPIVEGIRCARHARHIVRQNLLWAVLYNATAVPLAATGTLQPWIAAVGMSASSLLVVLNAMRLLKRDRAVSAPAMTLDMEAIQA
jgi:Cu2+-exporting ATPase